MKSGLTQWWESIPAKGGLFGALFGTLAASKYHRPGDKVLKNAGKTALFAGAGFMLGQWIETLLQSNRNNPEP
jgi:hypothetical protein